MIEAFDIPIKDLKAIKQGADFVDKEGFIVPNERLTTPADPIRKYAYISDTLYTEKIIDQIAEADILFHESTFVDDDKQVAKDGKEAVVWFRRAADQGHAQAQFNLGLMYDEGEGVAKDGQEAVVWYRRAADQGLAQAQYNLELMYYQDEGV